MLAADAHLHTRPSPAPARPGGSTRARESDPRRWRSPVPPPAIKRQIPATGAKGSDALGRARRSPPARRRPPPTQRPPPPALVLAQSRTCADTWCGPFAECQGLVGSTGELYDFSRIVRFLDNWGIINYLAVGSVHCGWSWAGVCQHH
jgi:hypothetical protein